MQILRTADRMPVSGTRRTNDGYLVAECRVAKGGNIQDYFGYELGIVDGADASKVFKIFRPEDEVFKADTLSTFAHRPVTMGHPPEGVTADNWRQTAVGVTGSEVVRDGEFVRVPLAVMDAGAIRDVEAGVREFSMGYECEVVLTAGTTKDGRAYDGFQKNHRMNHVAIVEVGRAGPECRFGDQSRNHPQQKEIAMTKSVTIDGKAYEVTDELAPVISKLQADAEKASKAATTLGDAAKAIDDAAKAVADLKAENADLKGKIEAATKAIPTADQVLAMASELADAKSNAKIIAPELDTAGKSAADIRKAAVAAKLGDAAIAGKSDDYIAATFDHLAKQADHDPVAAAFAGRSADTVTDAGDKAFLDYRASLSKAWQTAAN